MANQNPKIDPLWLNQRDMAKAVGVSTQAFRRWEIEPIARDGREAFYSFRDVLEARVEHELKRANRETPPDDDIGRQRYVEEYRLSKARRIAQELKNDEAEGRLIPTEFATFALSRMAAEIASILDTLPLAIRRAHPDLEARHIDSITREVARARNKAAEVDEILPALVEEYDEG